VSNVGYEVYSIRTQVTGQGGRVEKGFYVDKRSRQTRARRWEQLDEDLTYAGQDLDRSVVVPSQIRTVLQAFRDALFTELFPGRPSFQDLIFCKDDSHAEDVVHLVREVLGKAMTLRRRSPTRPTIPKAGVTRNPRRSSRSSALRPSSALRSRWT